MRPTPIHSRRVTGMPNRRSASTVSRTSPPAIDAWTSEIGASDRAPTWKPHDTIATTIPKAYSGERNRTIVLCTGRRMSTAGASRAPRNLNRNPATDPSAVSSASSRPSCTDSDIVVSA